MLTSKSFHHSIFMAEALLLFLAFAVVLVHASPPGPVVTCSSGNTTCIVTNSYGTFPDRTTCAVAEVAYPTTETELFGVVSAASLQKQHMKVVTVYSHSMPKLSCPGGQSGSGLVISTMYYDKVVEVDLEANRVTVQSGIRLAQFIDAAAAVGLALPYTPYWLGMTIGGLLGTGSHGSSLFGKGSAVHEYVVGMRLVVPTNSTPGVGARIIDLGENDADLLAAKVSLGVLGVVSQVSLQLQPMFKRTITNRVLTDVAFESTVASFAATTEFGDVTWYPSQEKVVFRDDVRVPLSTPGAGLNDYTGFRAQPSILIVSTRIGEELAELAGDSSAKCLLARIQVTTLLETGLGYENNNGRFLDFTGYPIIGNQSDLQSSGSCLNSDENNLLTVCGWDPRIRGLFYHQTTVSIPLTSIVDFIGDVKKLKEARPESLCGTELYSGFLMRFVSNSTAYLGKTDDAVDIDITYYRSHDAAVPRLNEDVLEEVEQMALFKYNGLPHWGKNRNIGFLGVREKFGSKADEFVDVMNRFDPEGLFSSDWSDAVLGLRGKTPVIVGDGCALEGLCICSTDDHCAPAEGYLCEPGIVYTEARVCRKSSSRVAVEIGQGGDLVKTS